jgi:DNA-binding NarL/FixJ family response regulator
MTTRVFLLDDHEIVRRGLRELFDAEDDLRVVGEAGTAEEAISLVPKVRPDVAILDVRLPDGDGVERGWTGAERDQREKAQPEEAFPAGLVEHR